MLVAADEHNGAYWWTRFELADLPNDLLGLEDLKRIGIELLDGRAVVKGEGFYAGDFVSS